MNRRTRRFADAEREEAAGVTGGRRVGDDARTRPIARNPMGTRGAPPSATIRARPSASRLSPVGIAALRTRVGNRAVGRLLARAPASDLKGGPDKSYDVRNGLSPQELWKLVERTRGLTSRVPPHGVAEADSRLAEAQHALEEHRGELEQARDDPALRNKSRTREATLEREAARGRRDRLMDAVASAEKQLRRQEAATRSAHLNASEAPPSDPDVEDDWNPQQLGHGVKTYGAIQVTNKQGRRVAVAIGGFTFDKDLHAEQSALNKIRAYLEQRGVRPGTKFGAEWTVTVVVDQEVCEEHCVKALREFAADYGIDPENVVAHYPQQQGRDVSPKGASKTAHLYQTTVPDGPGHRVLAAPSGTVAEGEGGGGPAPPGGEGPPRVPSSSPPQKTSTAPPTAHEVAPAPHESTAPDTSTSTEPAAKTPRELAAELTQKERWTRQMVRTTAVVHYGLHAWNAWNMVKLAAQSLNMAAATASHGTPYWRAIEQAEQKADTAKEIQDQYNALDLRANMPSRERNPDEWEIVDDLRDTQLTYLQIEDNLRVAQDSVLDAARELVRQQIELKDGLGDREKELIFPETSVVWAEVILYASAGGEINERLVRAIASYVDADRTVEAHRRFAQAAVRTLEQRLRALDTSGLVSEIPDAELATTPLRLFTLRRFQDRRKAAFLLANDE